MRAVNHAHVAHKSVIVNPNLRRNGQVSLGGRVPKHLQGVAKEPYVHVLHKVWMNASILLAAESALPFSTSGVSHWLIAPKLALTLN